MLTGDASIEVEKELLASDFDLESEVLKAGHHGSKTSSCLEFISAVSPRYGVISAGKDNKFNHPNLRVLKNFEKKEIPVLQTMGNGEIVFQSDGTYLWLK